MPAFTDISLQGYNVLVIEDDPASRLFLSRLIAKCGAQVQTAECGNDGLKLFEQVRFPLIVTDICMPGMDGNELVRRIRQIDLNVQIIATSANSEEEGLLAHGETGFSEYILKPVEIDALLSALKRCRDRIAGRQLHHENGY